MAIRRRVLVIFGAAMLVHPLALFAQSRGMVRRIGVLSSRSPVNIETDYAYGPFLRAMRDLGYTEGKNLRIEWRFADGKDERLPDLAAELVRSNVEVIVSTSTTVTHALQKATSTIPIVMTTVGDPVGSGFIKSLRQPGGNITGLTNMLVELSVKHLEMLHGAIPKLVRVAVLVNPNNSSNIETFRNIRPAAEKLGIRPLSFEVRSARQIEDAFGAMGRESIQAVVLSQDGLFVQHRQLIAELALKYRLPSVAAIQELADAGLLIAYGPNFPDIYRRAATYVDKILKGVKPADLPVEQPMRFDFVVNMKTAKALGLTIPPEIMVQATQVIQ